jgi:TldD protein
VVERGKLVNFLMGRNPIRDFPASNGHGRMAGRSPGYGNLFVKPSVSSSREELLKKMLDLCRERQLDYGYLIETFGGIASPRLIYRVYVQDGRRELVRGTAIDELNPRSLRNELIAAGNDQFVSNRPEAYRSVICPSLLFRELVIKPANQPKVKLPEYPPPPAGANR